MNNPEIPVGTTAHIEPEDIKWRDNGDLISRSALKKAIKSYADDQYAENEYLGECAIMAIIDNAPTVVVTDYDTGYQDGLEDGLNDIRPQGEWVTRTYRRLLPWDHEPSMFGDDNYDEKDHSVEDTEVVCSCCGELKPIARANFCPNCGTQMVRGKEE